jgi:uncharacterized protein YkwD
MRTRTRTHGRLRKPLQYAATVGVAALLAGIAVPFSMGGASADTVSDEARYVALINASRTAEGLKPLAVHPALVDAARHWASEMENAWDPQANEICQISHNPNLRTAVAANWQKLGENVGCGDVDVDALEQKFMESPKHRANIMDPSFDSIGIGIVMKGDVMFVTQQFMELRSSTPPPAAVRAPAALALAAPTTTVPRPRVAKAVKRTVKRHIPLKKSPVTKNT